MSSVAVKPDAAAAAASTSADAKMASSDSKIPAVDESKFVSRKVVKAVESVEQAEGHGARVRRSIGRPELRQFDPFLMLDEFNVGPPAGFPDHPHRGFETVTYMLPTTKGSFAHEDFCGHKGIIGPGDLQWMTAGKGIVHSEMPASTDRSHGLQLWVNLKPADKLCEPAYQELPAKDIPQVTKDGVTAIVIAGQALGTESKVYTRTPTYYLHFMMDENSSLVQAIPKGWNSFLYTLEGEIFVGSDQQKHKAHHTLVLSNDKDKEDGVIVKTKTSKASFVILSGEPIGAPVVQHGPFVMNTRAEIMQAFDDYQSGKNGFERAPGWRSEIGKPITDMYA